MNHLGDNIKVNRYSITIALRCIKYDKIIVPIVWKKRSKYYKLIPAYQHKNAIYQMNIVNTFDILYLDIWDTTPNKLVLIMQMVYV